MSSTQSSPADIVRRGILKIDSLLVLDAVDSLDLRGAGKVSAVVGVPLRNLQQRRNVSAFATFAPLPAVRALLEILATGPLEQVIQDLGDHAGAPSYEQLSAAVDKLLDGGATNDEIVALLAFAIGEEFPASLHCRRLLEERADFELPVLVVEAPVSSLLAPKEIDLAVREQRRVRREEAKRKKKQDTVAAQSIRQNKNNRRKKVDPASRPVGRHALDAHLTSPPTHETSRPPISASVDDFEVDAED